jgi:hypothetical protein
MPIATKAVFIPLVLVSYAMLQNPIDLQNNSTANTSDALVPPLSLSENNEFRVTSKDNDSVSTLTNSSKQILIKGDQNQAISTLNFSPLTTGELQNLSGDELFDYMLLFRENNKDNAEFRSEEYQLFRLALRIDSTAALDYFVALHTQENSEFYYNFIYNDFMVHEGRTLEVIDYLNRFGPNPQLLNLVVFADRFNEIDATIQREVVNEFQLGNMDYYHILKAARWYDDLPIQEKTLAFVRSNPIFVRDPFELIKEMTLYESDREVQEKLIEYLTVHDEKYSIYSLIKRRTAIKLEPIVSKLMSESDQYPLQQQIQIALMGLDFGRLDALRFLIQSEREFHAISNAVNVRFFIMEHIEAPPYIDKTIDWLDENMAYFRFNPYSGKFEY